MQAPKIRIQRNFLWKSAGDGSRAFLAVFLLLVARHYGPATFGVFSLVYAAAIFFSIVADFGLNLLTTRQIAAHKREAAAYLRTFFTCKLAICPLWVLAAAAIHHLGLVPGASWTLLVVMMAAHATRNLVEFFGAAFTGIEAIQYEAGLKLSAHLFMLAAGLWVMGQELSIEWIGVVMLAGYSIGMFLGFMWSHRRWKLMALEFHPTGLSILYAEALPLILMAAGLATLTKWNTILMGFFGISTTEIGWFSASEKVISGLGMFPALVTAAAYPVLADFHHNDPNEFSRTQRRLLGLFLAGGILCGLGLIMAGRPLIHLLYGSSYASAQMPLSLLGIGLIFTFPNYLIWNAMVASERSWNGAWAALGACLANVLLNLLLIPRWGMPGSALASSLSEGVFFLSGVFLLSRYSVRCHTPGGAEEDAVASVAGCSSPSSVANTPEGP